MSRRIINRAGVLGRRASVVLAVAAFASPAFAQFAVDGSRGTGTLAFGEYQFKLATQTNATGFGNLYSQLDGLFVNVLADGSLQMLVAGNLEGNYNGMMIWMDNGRPGATSLGNQLDRSIGSISGERGYAWGTRDGTGNGSIFAEGFDPARLFTLRGNNEVDRGPTNTYYNNYTDTSRPSAESGDADVYLGANSWITRLSNQSGNTGTLSTAAFAYNYQHFGINYSGTITQSFDSSNDVTFANNSPVLNGKGYEVQLTAGPWGLRPGEEAKIMAIVTGSSGDFGGSFLSNQALPGVASGTGNLGNPGGQGNRVFNSNVNGITFLTVPTPTNASGSVWFDDSQWNTGFSPNGTNTQARFNSTDGVRSVGINGTPAVGTIYLSVSGTGTGVSFSDSNSGGADLTIRTIPGDRGVIRSTGGAHSVNVPLKLASPVDVDVATGSSLTVGSITATDVNGTSGVFVTGGGTLKVTSGYQAGNLQINLSGSTYLGYVDLAGSVTAIVRQGDVAGLGAAVAGFLASGNTGLGSSDVTANTTLAVFPNNDGAGNAFYASYNSLTATAADVIVRVTYKGDTNVDGILNATDLVNILEGYSTGATGWENGDIDYSGTVTASDVAAFLAVYNLNLPQLPGGPTGSGPGGGVIPEPATLGLLAGFAPLALRRRKR